MPDTPTAGIRCAFAAALLAVLNLLVIIDARQLQQVCPIWRCAPGRCVLEENDEGVRVWACSACLPTYRLLGRQSCACAPGFYESSSRCVQCERGYYCRGGNGNGANATSSVGTTRADVPPSDDGLSGGERSYLESCGNQTIVTTANKGSISESACLARAGYFFVAGGAGGMCPLNTYNPGANRIPACYRCPSGLITTSPGAAAKRECAVPAGWTIIRGTAMPCPRGGYREGDVSAGSTVACRRCPRGWTTTGTGSRNKTDCNLLLPGFRQAEVHDPGVTAAQPCPLGTFNIGGTPLLNCTACDGYTTKAVGSKSRSECVAPPGFFLNNNTLALETCTSGSFAAGWGRRTACTACGINIPSDPNSPDESPNAAPGAQVRGSASNCFIPAGWGMMFNRASGGYRATLCAKDTYGVATKEYGLKTLPCTPCSRGMVTDSPGSTGVTDCYNQAGWGFTGSTAEVCGPGWWSAARSNLPCTPCPPNRNTTANTSAPFFMDVVLPAGVNGSAQDGVEDCKVIAGFGVVGNATGTPLQLATWDTVVCPVGTWSPGGGLTTNCSVCVGARTTTDTGSTSEADCAICQPGYGLSNSWGNGADCTGCSAGYYQDGTTAECTQCAASSFSFAGKVDTVSDIPATSKAGAATTPGATSPDQCYPLYFQMDDYNMGTHLVDTTTLTVASNYTNTSACAAACVTEGCLASTWVYNSWSPFVYTGSCFIISEPLNGSIMVGVKVLPLDPLGGQTTGQTTGQTMGQTKGQAAASGAYLYWKGDAENRVGESLGVFTGVDVQVCKGECDNRASCVLFYYQEEEGGKCDLRVGLLAGGVRTFIYVDGPRIDSWNGTAL